MMSPGSCLWSLLGCPIIHTGFIYSHIPHGGRVGATTPDTPSPLFKTNGKEVGLSSSQVMQNVLKVGVPTMGYKHFASQAGAQSFEFPPDRG